MQEPDRPITRTGGCQCGAVRYELSAEPLALYVCHCRECRRQSASAFGISVIAPRAALRLTARHAPLLVPAHRQRQHPALRLLPGLRLAPVARGRRARGQHQGRLARRARRTCGPRCISGPSRMLPGIVLPEGAVSFPGEPD